MLHGSLSREGRSREVRLARTLLWLIPVSFITVLIVGRLIITSDTMSREIATFVAGELANRTHASVQVSGIRFGLDFAPCFRDLEFRRDQSGSRIQVKTKEACVEEWASAVGSGFHAVRIRLDGPSIALSGAPDDGGAPAFVDVKPTVSTATKAQTRSALREIQLVFDDLRLHWEGMPVPEQLASGDFGPIDGTVTVQMRGRQSAATISIREPESGSTINGRVTPTGRGWDLSAGIEGDLVPIFKGLLASSGLDIRRLSTRGQIGATYGTTSKQATIDVDLEQYDVDLASDVVSRQRLAGFAARQKARVEVDLKKKSLRIQDGLLEVNGIPLVLSLGLAAGEKSPTFDVRIDLRTTPLLRILRAIPGSGGASLAQDLSPEIQFAVSFSMAGALRDPTTWQPRLDHGVQGLKKEGSVTGYEFIKAPFQYFPLTPEGRSEQALLVGPGTPGWMPYKRVPYILRRLVIVSEDSSFYLHQGLDLDEMRAALGKAVETGERARGGSTLSQQLIKNLFLTRERSALRKVQEAILTLHLESTLSKDQIFELYVNLIEWGPDVYGLRGAAQHYFGREPDRLSPLEMAYLVTIIPGPVLFHTQYEEGVVPPKHFARVINLLEKLNRLEQLSSSELESARGGKIRFTRPKKSKS
jgi:penicillin-binding protein 1A